MRTRLTSTQRPVWLDALFKSERGRALSFLSPSPIRIARCSLAVCAWRGMDTRFERWTAAAAYFSIFHELLADHIKGIVEAQGDDVRQANMEERVKSMCCPSIERTFSALMLLSLGQDDSRRRRCHARSPLVYQKSWRQRRREARRRHGEALARGSPWLPTQR